MGNSTYHPRGKLVHGYRVGKHPLYITWADMKSRCNDLSSQGYHNYGGRRIKVCERWNHFENFANDMWPKPHGKSLERKDNNKGYYRENCIWATLSEQAHNRRKFSNNTSGEKGIVPLRSPGGGYNARYNDQKIRYDLGNYDTVEEATKIRNRFIKLYKANDIKYKEMCVNDIERRERREEKKERRLRRDSTTKIKGISIHGDGFIIRKYINGQRKYLGFTKTLDEAIIILEST